MGDKVADGSGLAFPAKINGPVERVKPAVPQSGPVTDVMQPRRGDQRVCRRWRHRRNDHPMKVMGLEDVSPLRPPPKSSENSTPSTDIHGGYTRLAEPLLSGPSVLIVPVSGDGSQVTFSFSVWHAPGD
jgi:hypothetical protein